MIASLRGLLVLAAIAAGLAAALLLGSPASPILDRTLVPGFNPDGVVRLRISHAGAPPLELVRSTTGWVTRGQPAHPDPAQRLDVENDRSTVEALLAALRGATWHRRADPSVAAPSRGQLSVSSATGNREILVGREVAGSAQTWLVLDGRAVLVDTWVARALLPDPLELRVRQPFAGAAVAVTVRGPDVQLEGQYQRTPVKRWLAESAYTEIVSALADLTIVSLEIKDVAMKGRSVSLEPAEQGRNAIEMSEAGTCEGGRVRVETSHYGAGCVERAAWERVLAAFQRLAQLDDPTLVDTRIAPLTPQRVSFRMDPSNPTNETVLELAGRPHLGANEDVDLDRVHELVVALAAPGEIIPRPTTAPRMALLVAGADRTALLSIFDGVIARDDEAFALRPSREAFAIITRPVATLRDPVLWREDATTLTSVTLDGITYLRGAVIGEWSRTPSGKLDPALVDSLVETLARVRGPAGTAPTKVAHTIAVTFTPPTGQPVTHTLELGLPTAEGCAARVDRKPVRLDLPLCTAAVALAASR